MAEREPKPVDMSQRLLDALEGQLKKSSEGEPAEPKEPAVPVPKADPDADRKAASDALDTARRLATRRIMSKDLAQKRQKDRDAGMRPVPDLHVERVEEVVPGTDDKYRSIEVIVPASEGRDERRITLAEALDLNVGEREGDAVRYPSAEGKAPSMFSEVIAEYRFHASTLPENKRGKLDRALVRWEAAQKEFSERAEAMKKEVKMRNWKELRQEFSTLENAYARASKDAVKELKKAIRDSSHQTEAKTRSGDFEGFSLYELMGVGEAQVEGALQAYMEKQIGGFADRYQPEDDFRLIDFLRRSQENVKIDDILRGKSMKLRDAGELNRLRDVFKPKTHKDDFLALSERTKVYWDTRAFNRERRFWQKMGKNGLPAHRVAAHFASMGGSALVVGGVTAAWSIKTIANFSIIPLFNGLSNLSKRLLGFGKNAMPREGIFAPAAMVLDKEHDAIDALDKHDEQAAKKRKEQRKGKK